MSKQKYIHITDHDLVAALIQYLLQNMESRLEFNRSKNILSLRNDSFDKVLDVRLPLYLRPLEDDTVHTIIERLKKPDSPHYVLLLIQAGYAAMAVATPRTILKHKTIAKYMVRKKQGKAQITHLKTKGKSRAGSRIRLANTVLFFEEINERLHEWLQAYELNRIIYHCTPQLWGMLYDTRIKPPFDKKDTRLIKIPEYVHRPTFKELTRINQLIKKSVVKIYRESYISAIHDIMRSVKQDDIL
ncbi:MAG: hypothetical protein GF313_00315 [Caldithrix sp.]|nr:hypothetical protein [Caldithrix sp.]